MGEHFAEIPVKEGYSKLISLEEAVNKNIKPGMNLHFAFAHSSAHAVAMEIIRQFLQQSMHFTLTGTGIMEYGIMLSWAGLVDKIIGSFIGDTYPSPTPIIPDLAIIHGLVADEYGNTVIGSPYGENLWGAYAARQGILVTVEKIVSTAEIRELCNYVKIPGHLVSSVSIVPFGAHPQGMSVQGIPDLHELGYSEDYEARRQFRAVAYSAESLDAWMKKWVINTTHQSYLQLLGDKRLKKLREAANKDFVRAAVNSSAIDDKQPITSSELQIINAARVIGEKTASGAFSTLLAGIGTAHIASWLAKFLCKDPSNPWELLTETGFYGDYPRLGDPYLFNYANISTSKMQTHFLEVLGCLVNSEGKPCLGLLSAAQVDRFGSFNSTKIPAKKLCFTSGGGSNDVASAASEVIIVIPHSPKRLVNQVSFGTGNGNRVKTIATDKAILSRNNTDEPFNLTGCYVPVGQSLDTAIQKAKEECGWDLIISENLMVLPSPSRKELACLRAMDPEGDIIK